MRVSLALLVIDLLAVAASFFWKVRTDLEQQHAHYALFYFNELGPRKAEDQYEELTEAQEKQRKSILPSMVYYMSRLPLIITIILFHEQPLTQSICLFIYSVFLLGINAVIEYRRRVYRILTLFTHTAFAVCAGLLVMMCCKLDVAIWLDCILVVTFSVLLLCTVGQLLSNYELFISIFDYSLARFCGRKSS